MLLDGRTRSDVLRHAEQAWDISERQADEYIRQATAAIDEANAATTEHHLALITSNLWGLYRSQIKKAPGQARQVLLDIAKLRGLENNNMTVRIERPHKEASDEELAAVIGGARD